MGGDMEEVAIHDGCRGHWGLGFGQVLHSQTSCAISFGRDRNRLQNQWGRDQHLQSPQCLAAVFPTLSTRTSHSFAGEKWRTLV